MGNYLQGFNISGYRMSWSEECLVFLMDIFVS